MCAILAYDQQNLVVWMCRREAAHHTRSLQDPAAASWWRTLLHNLLEFKHLQVKGDSDNADVIWQYVNGHRCMCSHIWACSRQWETCWNRISFGKHVWRVRPLPWNWRRSIDLEQKSRASKWESKRLQPWTPQASAHYKDKIKLTQVI